MGKKLRRSYFVDRDIQGRLLALFLRFWALSLGTAGGLTVIGWIFVAPGITGFVGPNSFMVTILPMVLVGIVASILVLPLLMYELIRATHRFAGPLVKFHRQLREAADGGPLTPVHFREGDDWTELAESYNALIERINAEHPSLACSENIASSTAGREQVASVPPTPLEPAVAGDGVNLADSAAPVGA